MVDENEEVQGSSEQDLVSLFHKGASFGLHAKYYSLHNYQKFDTKL